MAVAYRTVLKTWLDPQGQPYGGTVRFELVAGLGDTETLAIMPAAVDVAVVGGEMTFAACPVRDDPLLMFEVTPKLIDSAGVAVTGRPYYVVMPFGVDPMQLPDKSFVGPWPPPVLVPPAASVPSVVPLPVGAAIPEGLPDFSVIVRY